MYLFFKRLFDILFSLFLIILISPLFLIITVCLLIYNKGEIFYIQKRIGFKNRTFGIKKFATMLKNSESLPGGSITLRNDTRVAKIGRLLRITKLNELPQLFNVLFGDMSFVGPRPMLQEGFNLYTPEVQTIIYLSRPGITGISSIIFRDEERLVTESGMDPKEYYKSRIFPYKGELEQWYSKNRSICIDFLILFLTGLKIIAPGTKLEFKLFPSLPKSDYFQF